MTTDISTSFYLRETSEWNPRNWIEENNLLMGFLQKRLFSFADQEFSEHPTPKKHTIKLAGSLLNTLGPSQTPDIVNPSPEGGIALEYIRPSDYRLIELYDDYTAVYIEKKGGSTTVMDFDTRQFDDMLAFLKDAI